MDIELNHRRTISAVMATFSRVWPYIAIAALLALHAVNYSAPQAHKVASQVKRRALDTNPLQPPVDGSDLMFVTFYATGKHGDGGFHTHQFSKPDMRWVDVVRKSHPGCSVAYVLDQDTQLESYEGLDVHRIQIDKEKFGRNAYNDLYHWTARFSYLEKLISEGREMYNVMYIDPDILIMDDLHGIFERSFDYSVTISDNEDQPINGAMHFVPKGKYHEAVEFIKGVLSVYDLDCRWMFTCGQQAYADYVQISNNNAERRRIEDGTIRYGRHCSRVRDKFEVCFLSCISYNYWEKCMEHDLAPMDPNKVVDFERNKVKVFHFVAWRKVGMQVVYEAYMKQGLEAAYATYAALPHEEDGYNDPNWLSRAEAAMKAAMLLH